MSVDVTEHSRPVLDYATKDADGLPAWVAEAENLIEQKQPPRKIRRFFRNAEQAVRYFGKSMSRRHGPEMFGDRCQSCGSVSPMYVLKVTWLATCPPRFLEFRISEKEIAAPFATMHPLCSDCVSHWMKRLVSYATPRSWLGWIRWGMFSLFFAAMVAGMAPIVRSYVGRGWRDATVWIYIAAIAVVTVSAALLDLLWRRRQPRTLKRMMPKDVSLTGMGGVFVRENGVLRSLTD